MNLAPTAAPGAGYPLPPTPQARTLRTDLDRRQYLAGGMACTILGAATLLVWPIRESWKGCPRSTSFLSRVALGYHRREPRR